MAVTSRAHAFVSRWFDEATVRHTFEPLIADWQREWQDASPSRRQVVTLRALFAFICAVVVCSPHLLLTPTPSIVTRQIAIRVIKFAAVTTLVFMIPPVIETSRTIMRGTSWMPPSYFLFALPGAMMLAIPFALAGAVDAIRRSALSPHLARAVVLKLGLLAVGLMLLGTGWLVPASRQASRSYVNPPGMSAPLRGMSELTTFELVVDPARATIYAPGTLSASRSTSIARELNSRAMMAALPIVLLWLRWRAHDGPAHRFGPAPIPVAAAASMAMMLSAAVSGAWLEREGHMPAGSTYWLPIAMFVAWGMLSARCRRLLPART